MQQFDVNYKYGFHDNRKPFYTTPKGLSEKVVREISYQKNEPEWMLTRRLGALQVFYNRHMPPWSTDLSQLDFNDIYYYVRPTEKQATSWEDLPPDIKNTYDKIGIPEAEKKYLAGVGAQYDSEVVYHSISKMLEEKGVIFCDTDTALKKYPELFKEYFGKIIPAGDNKIAALNTAVWSGGSFIYVPKGVHVTLPLQAYFRINAQNMGQFERTLIIADDYNVTGNGDGFALDSGVNSGMCFSFIMCSRSFEIPSVVRKLSKVICLDDSHANGNRPGG